MKATRLSVLLVSLSVLMTGRFTAPCLSAPLQWGNQYFYDMAIGEEVSFLGKIVKLVANDGPYAVVRVDGTEVTLPTVTRSLPAVVNGVRLFIAFNRPFERSSTHDWRGLGNHLFANMTKDAMLVLSDPALPLLPPETYTFPISRADGFDWQFTENSHNFAFLQRNRIHEGIDINMHLFRDTEQSPLVAVEDARVVWTQSDSVNGTAVFLESLHTPGIYYVYQHLNNASVRVAAGEKISKGQIVGYIRGDGKWGHLHFTVVTKNNDYAHRYDNALNLFPGLYELWYGDLADHSAPRIEADWKMYNAEYWKQDYTSGRYRYDEIVGFGWKLGAWCPGGAVEHDDNESVLLRKTLYKGTAAAVTNPDNYYDFEVDVMNGDYEVAVELGAANKATSQQVEFEGVLQGTYSLASGEFAWTPRAPVNVTDGKLTLRFVTDGDAYAGIRHIRFRQIPEPGSVGLPLSDGLLSASLARRGFPRPEKSKACRLPSLGTFRSPDFQAWGKGRGARGSIRRIFAWASRFKWRGFPMPPAAVVANRALASTFNAAMGSDADEMRRDNKDRQRIVSCLA
jgi:murein DD-endopeptidase MepM/ murein hydrolase activator NlpD